MNPAKPHADDEMDRLSRELGNGHKPAGTELATEPSRAEQARTRDAWKPTPIERAIAAEWERKHAR